MGAWIETLMQETISVSRRRTLCGCVDWNCVSDVHRQEFTSRTLCGCVDWNYVVDTDKAKMLESHHMWVRGLKHLYLCALSNLVVSHPMWVLDWNTQWTTAKATTQVAPYVGAWIETIPLDTYKGPFIWMGTFQPNSKCDNQSYPMIF